MGYINGGKGWMFYDKKRKTLFPSSIAMFPYEPSETQSTPSHEAPKVKDSDRILDTPAGGKGSLKHIINSLKFGDFLDKVKINKEDIAASVALDGSNYLKILEPRNLMPRL